MNTSRLLTYSCIFFCSIFLTACSEKTSIAEVEQPYHLLASVITIKPQASYTIERAYTGQVSIRAVSQLGFEFSGLVSNVFVDNGDRVQQGQILAEQSTELLTIKKQELLAQKAQVKAKLNLNKNNLERITKLERKGYSSQQALDNLTTEKETLMANLQGILASLNAIKYQLNHSKIMAPFNGIIASRKITQGEVVNAGMPVLHLIRQGEKQITLGLPAKLTNTVKLNQIVTVAINNKKYPAQIIAMGEQVDPTNRTIELRLALGKNIQAFNGQLAQVFIPQKIQNQGAWIPISALTDGIRGQWNIYTVNKSDHNLYQIEVETVRVLHTTKEHAYIALPKKAPYQIIAEGVHRFVGGQKVRITTKNEQEVANKGVQS